MQIIAENTAKFAGGRYLKHRYADIVKPKKQAVKKDPRTGEQIAADIIKKVARKGV